MIVEVVASSSASAWLKQAIAIDPTDDLANASVEAEVLAVVLYQRVLRAQLGYRRDLLDVPADAA
jgi:hypothetical protein